MSVGAVGAGAAAAGSLDRVQTVAQAEVAAENPPAPPASAPVGANTEPFLNSAFADIAARASSSPTDHVLYGDSGLLIQAYGAVALLTGPLNAPQVYVTPPAPVIPPVAKVAPYPRTPRIDHSV